MDYWIQNSHHFSAAQSPQTRLEPESQQPQQAGVHLYSANYSTANPNPYPNSIHSNILDLDKKKKKLIDGGAAANEIRACTVCNVICNSDIVLASHLSGEKHALKAFGAKPNFICEVCKIYCNSQDTLKTHKIGKKHKRNLQKLQEIITLKPSSGVEEVKKAYLQTKKEKVILAGADEGAIMVFNV